MEDGLFIMKRYVDEDEDQSSDEKCQETNSSQVYQKSESKQSYVKEKTLKRDETQNSDKESLPEAVKTLTDLHDKQNLNTKNTEHKRKRKRKKINKQKDDVVQPNITQTSNASPSKCSVEGNQAHKIKKSDTVEKVSKALPNWLINPTRISINLHEIKTSISELQYLDNVLVENLNNAGITYLFPVQTAVIPWLLQTNQTSLMNRPSDLCVSAPTGSGKTLAFVLPIVQSLKGRVVCAVRALVVLPVNELAIQVFKVFEKFVVGTDLKVVLLTGQKSFNAEQKSLMKSNTRQPVCLADIVVTTPGRILDHIHKTEGFSLELLRYLVIDEADRMMDEIQKGWLKQIENAVFKNVESSSCACFSTDYKRVKDFPTTACLKSHINPPLQKLLYSATLTHDPEKLHSLALYQPKLFASVEDHKDSLTNCNIPEDLEVKSITCKQDMKPLVLCNFVIEGGFKKVLCFAETTERAERLSDILSKMNLIVVREISSNLNAVQRKIIFEQFNAGSINLLICSDLVSRGIDFEDVDCVISYDLPSMIKTYVHRIGRTARGGKKGVALMLLSEYENVRLDEMLVSESLPKPTELELNLADLEKYVDSFKNALSAAANGKSKKVNTNRNNKQEPLSRKRPYSDTTD